MNVRPLIAAGALLAAVLAPPAHADEFATTNVQLLQGWNFHDNELGYDTKSGQMTTLTLNHFSTWRYGDNFAFFDLYRGDFRPGYHADAYVEWHPRLFVNKLLGLSTPSFIKNWGLAAEVNQGRVFYAYMIGAGLDLAIPGFTVAGVNLYYRYDVFNYHTAQLSPFWTVPFSLGPIPFVFTGFLDTFFDRDGKIDVMAQPELLVDVGAIVGMKPNRVHAGIEWYLHHFTFLGETKTVSAPQAMFQWTVF